MAGVANHLHREAQVGLSFLTMAAVEVMPHLQEGVAVPHPAEGMLPPLQVEGVIPLLPGAEEILRPLAEVVVPHLRVVEAVLLLKVLPVVAAVLPQAPRVARAPLVSVFSKLKRT